MATYVRSGAGGTGDGSSWTNAYTTLVAAMAAKSAGEVFYVAHDHAETQASAMTLTCPGTVGSPCQILCVDDAAEPPTTLASTATISTTGTSNMTWTGFAYIHGITFNCGNGTGNVNQYWGSGAVGLGLVLSSCNFRVLATGTTSRIYFGGNTRDTGIYAINCTMRFSATAQRAIVRGWVQWYGGSYDATTAVPTSLFNTDPGYGCNAIFTGVDLSAMSGTLVLAGNNDLMRYHFRNCRLHASTTPLTATAIIGPGAGQVIVDNCDSGDTNYKINHQKYEGSIVTETTIKRTGGASDGTTGFSWKMVTLAAGPQFFWPLTSPPITIWNESIGSPMTATVEIIHDSATNVQDDEIWAEVEYLGTSGYPTSSLATDRMTDIMATPADQAASSETWTTTGLTNPNTQKLVVTFTPEEKGPVTVRVKVAKASQTVYVCPKVTLA